MFKTPTKFLGERYSDFEKRKFNHDLKMLLLVYLPALALIGVLAFLVGCIWSSTCTLYL